MGRGFFVIMTAALAVLPGACSWIPFTGSSAAPTNPAVEACKREADKLGYDVAGERSSAPAGEQRYNVVLDVRKATGLSQASCTFDPTKGAQMEPPRQAKP
jgi:hypothetical protein